MQFISGDFKSLFSQHFQYVLIVASALLSYLGQKCFLIKPPNFIYAQRIGKKEENKMGERKGQKNAGKNSPPCQRYVVENS